MKVSQILLILCLHKMYSQQTTQFNREHAVVCFNPQVSYWPADINLSTVTKMVGVIATRFTKISGLTLEGILEDDDAILLVPLAVATYNRDVRKETNPPLELTLHYSIDKLIGNDTKITQFLEFVVSWANDANYVFNGTVKTISFSHWKGDYALIEKHLTEAWKVFTRGPFSYSLALFMPFSGATGILWHLQRNSSSFTRLEHVIFSLVHEDSATEAPLDIFERLTTKLLKMKKILKEGKKQATGSDTLDVAIFTGYRGIPGRRDSTLVEYWKLYNDWTKETNTTILFHEAFDTHILGTSKWIGRGWWRLQHSTRFLHPSKFEFEEKESGLPLPREIQTESPFILTLPGVIVVLLAISLALSFVILIWIYFYKRAIRQLAPAEVAYREKIENFMKASVISHENRTKSYVSNTTTWHLGYSRDLEIPEDRFRIDKLHILGSGNFGIVCNANIISNGVSTQVAAKLTKENSCKSHVLGLINEIKILSWLGKHENLVSLVGACTSQILDGIVYVFLEYCQFGSLETYLKQHNSKISGDINNDLSVVDLFQWSSDISRGMLFLASKKIVHADLGTRNILLEAERRAKICDFGLSRYLNDNDNYVHTRDVEICWRWAAPESIRGRVFNEKTDVWSFGVTLWEIFSLGDLPYPDVSDSDELYTQLKNGRRLQEPNFSESNIYGKLIKKCWNFHSTLRPKFQDIVPVLQNITSNYDSIA